MGYYDYPSDDYVTDYHITITGTVKNGEWSMTKTVSAVSREVAIAQAAVELSRVFEDLVITDVSVESSY